MAHVADAEDKRTKADHGFIVIEVDGLRRVSYESYEVTYCPRCQTDGKVLADRRLSRLLK